MATMALWAMGNSFRITDVVYIQQYERIKMVKDI